MKVMKFGGTSVGTVDSLKNVKRIVESCDDQVIVVVSALGGLTDRLIATARLAEHGDMSYLPEVSAMEDRHREIIDTLVPDNIRTDIQAEIDTLFEALRRTYQGIYLLEELSERSLDKVVSFGERMSSRIITGIIDDAKLFDSLEFIRTLKHYGKHLLDNDATQSLISKKLRDKDFNVAVVPGFISMDSNGVITNLGRGGSDYTAAILAASLDAEVLEIWTDVDGFLTADPRTINHTRLIDSLSFTEAMELCNFGAKVIYPPTIYPVFHKNIPIYIKNTFRPELSGTCIKDNKSTPDCPHLKGVSSISKTALIEVDNRNVSDKTMSGKILNLLSRIGVSPLLVSEESNIGNVLLSVLDNEVRIAVDAIEREFKAELETGELLPPVIKRDLATIAIVVDNIRRYPQYGVMAIDAVNKCNISVLAKSQGNNETSISFVVPDTDRQTALQTVHDLFFV